MAYQKNKHDIGITDVGSAGAGTGITGLMLATQQDGSKAYREYDGKYLADQFFTGTPSQTYMNPEEELIFSGDDWRSGFGLEYYDSSDTKRYYSSIGMDLRHKGIAIAGWTPTTVTSPPAVATAAIVNANMETAASGWTGGARSGAQFYTGANSWKVSQTGIGSTNAYQEIEGWTPGDIITLKCWVKVIDNAAGNGHSHIILDDGDTETESAAVAHGGAWFEAEVTKTLSTTSSTRLRLILRSTHDAAQLVDGYFDDATIATDTPIARKFRCFAEFNDELYAGYQNVVAKLNAGGTAFTAVKSLPATITDLEAFPDDQLYIALGTSNDYWFMTAAEVFTASTANFKQFQFFCTVHGATPTIYGNDAVNKIRSTTAPTGAATWTGQTTVGSSYYDITGLVAWKGLLYIGKEDKPYYLDATPAIQDDLARELESAVATTSGKNLWIWKNELHYPAGDQALLHSDGTTNTFINPSKYCTNLSAFSGQVFAGAGDEEWNYVIVENTSTTEVEVMATRIETVDGTTSRVWHPIAEITLKGCETCHISTKVRKALWIASDDATDSLYYLQLPTTYGDIVNDSNKNFMTGTYFETPWLHGGFRSEDKAWIKLTLTMGHAYNVNDYFTVHYKVLGGSYVSIGDFTGISATDMIQSRFIDITNKPFSPMIKLKFTAVTGATSRTPILLNYDVRAVMYPSIRKIIHCVVRCANEMQTKVGGQAGIERGKYDTVKDTLDNARNNAVWPVSIRDISGDTLNVKFLPVSQETARMLPIKIEKGREQERLYHLLMLEIPLS